LAVRTAARRCSVKRELPGGRGDVRRRPILTLGWNNVAPKNAVRQEGMAALSRSVTHDTAASVHARA